MPRQPSAATSTPPRTGPNAALAELVAEMTPSVAAGGRPPARRRINVRPAGKPTDVPIACSTRAATTQPKPGTTSTTLQVTKTSARPAENTFLAPYRSASRPISGCPTAAVR